MSFRSWTRHLDPFKGILIAAAAIWDAIGVRCSGSSRDATKGRSVRKPYRSARVSSRRAALHEAGRCNRPCKTAGLLPTYVRPLFPFLPFVGLTMRGIARERSHERSRRCEQMGTASPLFSSFRICPSAINLFGRCSMNAIRSRSSPFDTAFINRCDSLDLTCLAPCITANSIRRMVFGFSLYMFNNNKCRRVTKSRFLLMEVIMSNLYIKNFDKGCNNFANNIIIVTSRSLITR